MCAPETRGYTDVVSSGDLYFGEISRRWRTGGDCEHTLAHHWNLQRHTANFEFSCFELPGLQTFLQTVSIPQHIMTATNGTAAKPVRDSGTRSHRGNVVPCARRCNLCGLLLMMESVSDCAMFFTEAACVRSRLHL